MGKFESLDKIKIIWQDNNIQLGEKAALISEEFYSSGLDFAATAAYIHATPSELDALLEIGGFEDDVLLKISEINPPKTAWTILSNASDDEVEHALDAIEHYSHDTTNPEGQSSVTEYVYFSLLENAEPTVETKIGNLSGRTIKLLREKATQFSDVISDKEINFLKSCASRRGRDQDLTAKQIQWLVDICNRLADREIISRNSIDGDQELCDEILDALGR